jgi:hypothetical protein
MAEGDTLLNAAIGAVVSVVLSFLPVSPAFGGGVAAHLQGGDREAGAKVGALSGALAAVPVAALFAVFGSFLLGYGFLGGGAVSLVGVGLVFVFVLVLAVAYSAVLGAIGGYVAVYLVEEDVL